MSHHQSAKAAVAKLAVMAVEINSESAANLIQSVTVHNFQSAPLPGSRNCVDILIIMLWPFRAAPCRNFSWVL
jgi:hypothetical protein